MKSERKETIYKLIEELEAVIAGVKIQQRLERDDVRREQKEVGWMSAGLVDTGALDALTDAITTLNDAKELLEESTY